MVETNENERATIAFPSWGLRSCGMTLLVTGWVIPDILRQRVPLNIQRTKSPKTLHGDADPWDHRAVSKRRTPIAQCLDVTSRKNGKLKCTASLSLQTCTSILFGCPIPLHARTVSSSLTFHSSLFSSCLWCIICRDCYIYGLFNDTLSNSRLHGVEWWDDYRTMNSKARGRKQSWPDLKCYSDPANSGLYTINRAVNLSVCLHYS